MNFAGVGQVFQIGEARRPVEIKVLNIQFAIGRCGAYANAIGGQCQTLGVGTSAVHDIERIAEHNAIGAVKHEILDLGQSCGIEITGDDQDPEVIGKGVADHEPFSVPNLNCSAEIGILGLEQIGNGEKSVGHAQVEVVIRRFKESPGVVIKLVGRRYRNVIGPTDLRT